MMKYFEKNLSNEPPPPNVHGIVCVCEWQTTIAPNNVIQNKRLDISYRFIYPIAPIQLFAT